MQPAKLGYAEIHFGADLKRVVPKAIPGFWRNPTLNIPYITQMKLFLDGQMNPKSIFYTRDGVNKNDAIMHLQSISNSHQMTYLDKLSTCGFLSSLWFKFVEIITDK